MKPLSLGWQTYGVNREASKLAQCSVAALSLVSIRLGDEINSLWILDTTVLQLY
jgi:hypothetical protein